MSEPTVADILNEAIERPNEAPPHPSLSDKTIAALMVLHARQEQEFRNVAAWYLCADIAERFDLQYPDVLAAMRLTPPDLWHLFDTPDGWRALVHIVVLTVTGQAFDVAWETSIH